MVKITDCSCECRDKGKEQQIEERALSSINKVLGTEGQAYYPDGTGAVTIPIADADQLTQIGTNAEDIATLERSQEKTETDIGQMKISIAENTEEIEKIQAVNDAQAKEIADIKADDGSRDTEIAGLKTRVTATEGDISDIQTVDAGQTTEINGLKTKTAQQATQISGLDALCESITKSLVTDVEVGVGTDAGSFIVSVVEEDGTRRSSDSFQYGRVGTFALMQGAQAGYVKGVLTLVDGTTVESNDFQILQVTASDVYVTSITLSADYQTGKIGGTIGYSNGNTAAINEILVPTAPGVTSNINNLLSRMTAVETKDRSQDASISDLTTRVETLEATPGIGKFTNTTLGTIQGSTADGKVSAGSDGTGSVNGWSTIKSDIASKASQSALNTTNAEVATKASQADLTALQNTTKDAFSEFSISAGADGVTVEMTALDGQSNSQTIPIVSDTAAGVVTKDMLSGADNYISIKLTDSLTTLSYETHQTANIHLPSGLDSKISLPSLKIAYFATFGNSTTYQARVTNPPTLPTNTNQKILDLISSIIGNPGSTNFYSTTVSYCILNVGRSEPTSSYVYTGSISYLSVSLTSDTSIGEKFNSISGYFQPSTGKFYLNPSTNQEIIFDSLEIIQEYESTQRLSAGAELLIFVTT